MRKLSPESILLASRSAAWASLHTRACPAHHAHETTPPSLLSPPLTLSSNATGGSEAGRPTTRSEVPTPGGVRGWSGPSLTGPAALKLQHPFHHHHTMPAD